MSRVRRRDCLTRLAISGLVLIGCSSKPLTKEHTTVECEASWREIEIPDELRGLPDGRFAVWTEGQLYVLSNNAFGFGLSPNLIYDPMGRFTRMASEGAPREWLTGVVGASRSVFATLRRDGMQQSFAFRYDIDENTWSALPDQGSGDTMTTTLLALGDSLLVGRGNIDGTDEPMRYFVTTSPWSSWRETPRGPAVSTSTSVSIATGAIFWGGVNLVQGEYVVQGTGTKYDLNSDSWSAMRDAGAPTPRDASRAVWTGTEAIVWGGFVEEPAPLRTGARYYPEQDAWEPVTEENAPEGRGGHNAVAVGRKMIIWGGSSKDDFIATGSVYDAATDGWAPLPTHCGPERSVDSAVVWIDDGLIVWGGLPNECDYSPFSEICEPFRERAWFLPREVALGEVPGDNGGCTCPEPIGAVTP